MFTVDAEWPGPYIDGEWRTDGRKTVTVENPATREQVTEVTFATAGDVDDAYEAIERAQSSWADSPTQRVQVFENAMDLLAEHRDNIVELLAVESGSAASKGHQEVTKSIDLLDTATQLPFRTTNTVAASRVPGKRNEVHRDPVGSVGVITPWNVPLKLAVQSIAPALALGNGVVLKPAPDTPISGGLVLARLFEEAGVPDGIFNVVPGYGEDIGARVVEHPSPKAVSFTGSTTVGQQVGHAAVDGFKSAMLELGGNNPHIVTEDADLDRAIDGGLFATFSHQGQACISINRHLVHESVYDEYVDRFAARAADLPIGDPRDVDTVIGPIINETQRDKIVGYIQETVEQGATVELGGEYDDLFVEPTVISGVTNDMAAACNEHFGPIAPVIPFSTDEEAVKIANDTEYGLTASVHAGTEDRARRIVAKLETGMAHINDQTVNSEPDMPFGGVGASGIGRHNGEWIIEKFTTTRWVSVQEESRDYPL
ncbi:aldehyde dehydrogenase family protein [Halobellus rufus]|uniref:aldehyde dehydrogenase family protein n=1 Tax=Halobellus rufus TaxID=1448860 RepID=UPI0006795B70|nr:aldehyde dehydrogenase family protein [Halobellus rufus]